MATTSQAPAYKSKAKHTRSTLVPRELAVFDFSESDSTLDLDPALRRVVNTIARGHVNQACREVETLHDYDRRKAKGQKRKTTLTAKTIRMIHNGGQFDRPDEFIHVHPNWANAVPIADLRSIASQNAIPLSPFAEFMYFHVWTDMRRSELTRLVQDRGDEEMQARWHNAIMHALQGNTAPPASRVVHAVADVGPFNGAMLCVLSRNQIASGLVFDRFDLQDGSCEVSACFEHVREQFEKLWDRVYAEYPTAESVLPSGQRILTEYRIVMAHPGNLLFPPNFEVVFKHSRQLNRYEAERHNRLMHAINGNTATSSGTPFLAPPPTPPQPKFTKRKNDLKAGKPPKLRDRKSVV